MNSIAWLFPWLFSGFLTKLTHFFFFTQLQFCVILSFPRFIHSPSSIPLISSPFSLPAFCDPASNTISSAFSFSFFLPSSLSLTRRHRRDNCNTINWVLSNYSRSLCHRERPGRVLLSGEGGTHPPDPPSQPAPSPCQPIPTSPASPLVHMPAILTFSGTW